MTLSPESSMSTERTMYCLAEARTRACSDPIDSCRRTTYDEWMQSTTEKERLPFEEEFDISPVLAPVRRFFNARRSRLLDPVGVGLSADGTRAYIGAQVNTLWIDQIGHEDERILSTTDIALNATHAALSADGRTCALAGSYGVVISELGQYVAASMTPVASVALSSDGKYIVCASIPTGTGHGRISVCTTDDMEEITGWSEVLNFGQCSVAISGDATLVAHAVVGGVYLVRVDTMEKLFYWRARGASNVSIDKAGAKIAIADENSLRVSHFGKFGTKERTVYMRAYSAPPFEPLVDISGNGQNVIAAMNKSKYGVFCTTYGNLLLVLDGLNGAAAGVATSDDATVVVAAAHPGQVCKWYLDDFVS